MKKNISSQIRIHHFYLHAFSILLIGCATSGNELTKENIDRANKVCEAQIKADQLQRNPKWFTRWLECKKEKLMPFDIMTYPTDEEEIRAMYDRLLIIGKNVDLGIWRVQDVYKEWDKMKLEIGMHTCLIRISERDGSSRCAPQ